MSFCLIIILLYLSKGSYDTSRVPISFLFLTFHSEYFISKIWTLSGGLTSGERSLIQEFPDEDRFRLEQASRNHSLRIPFTVRLEAWYLRRTKRRGWIPKSLYSPGRHGSKSWGFMFREPPMLFTMARFSTSARKKKQ